MASSPVGSTWWTDDFVPIAADVDVGSAHKLLDRSSARFVVVVRAGGYAYVYERTELRAAIAKFDPHLDLGTALALREWKASRRVNDAAAADDMPHVDAPNPSAHRFYIGEPTIGGVTKVGLPLYGRGQTAPPYASTPTTEIDISDRPGKRSTLPHVDQQLGSSRETESAGVEPPRSSARPPAAAESGTFVGPHEPDAGKPVPPPQRAKAKAKAKPAPPPKKRLPGAKAKAAKPRSRMKAKVEAAKPRRARTTPAPPRRRGAAEGNTERFAKGRAEGRDYGRYEYLRPAEDGGGGGGAGPRGRPPPRTGTVRRRRTSPIRAIPEPVVAGVRRRSSDKPQRAVVSTGFASADAPSKPVGRSMPLRAGARYFFWLEIGKLVAGAIDERPRSLPKQPVGTRLRVELFAFPRGFTFAKGSDTGELVITEAFGRANVVTQPAGHPEGNGLDDLLSRRLYFGLTTSSISGTHRLRCNIYVGQTLLQSRLVEARVMIRPRASRGALRTTLDYTIAHGFDGAALRRLPEYSLSVMANEVAGTHAFWLVGTRWKQQATFSDLEISTLLTQARAALRMTAWGNAEPWNGAATYRYANRLPRADFLADLVKLARQGYLLYSGIIDRFAGPRPKDEQLAEDMRAPGFVQIALKLSAGDMLPAAVMYDYRIETETDEARMAICPEFVKALDAKIDLASHACFTGRCESRGKMTLVCPSGFWGFRQNLGMPLTVADAPSAPTAIDYSGTLALSGAVSTALNRTLTHEKDLRALRRGLAWQFADSREAAFALMREPAELLYFYCHGGVRENRAMLSVGAANETPFGAADLRSQRILWEKTRPLVFINGCETIAMEPGQLLNLVNGFVGARASGVIGTETTVFEPLATVFAIACLRAFLIDGRPIGEAVRYARLALLAQENPMGLVYTPFVLPSVKLIRATRAARAGQDSGSRHASRSSLSMVPLKGRPPGEGRLRKLGHNPRPSLS